MKRRILITMLCMLVSLCASAQGKRGPSEPKLDKSLLELPSIKNGDEILVYKGFVVNYNTKRLIPNWVAYELTAEEVEGQVSRSNNFSMDLNYKGKQAMREDYSNSGWDKGHMAPAADMKWSQDAMYESFYLTNICPQNHELNGKDWQTLEKKCREWATKYGKVYIVCGPVVYNNRYGTIGNQKVVIPDSFFKAVLAPDGKGFKSIAFVMENTSAKQPLKNSVVSVNDVELLIGYDLFTNLNDKIEEAVESMNDLSHWN